MRPRTPLLLATCLSVAACGDVPRPTPPELAGDVALEVEIVSPSSGADILIVGSTVPVSVRAREEGGRVRGVGFVARRSGGADMPPVDSAFVTVRPVADTTVGFQLRLPGTLPSSSQVDIYGFALGPGAELRLSAPRPVLVLTCPPNAAWC